MKPIIPMPSSSTHRFPLLSLSLFLFFFFFTSIISPSHSSTPFSPSTNNITLFGDAHFTNTTISLTPQFNCRSPPSSVSSPQSGYGRAFFFSPIRFLDSRTNKTASFSTQFSFAITNPYSPFCPFGDGFTFLITSKTDSFSFGSMGLPNGQDFSYVAVEFDTMLDPNAGDINGNHVGIDVDSVVSVASVDGFSKGIDLKSGREMTAWIEYIDGEEMIKVWVGYSQIKPPSPLLISQIDLSKHFKEFMHVGFSASNGRGSAIHLVGGWKFKTYGLLPSMMPMEIVEGEGDCFMCSSPGDLGGQKSNANYHHIDKRVGELTLGLGGLAAFIVSLSAIVVIVIWCMIRKKRLNSRGSNEGYRYQGNKLPKRLSLSAIKSATKGFNHNRIIGEGGSATVYEGSLPSCGTVAVKRFSHVSQFGSFRSQFATEFVMMMGCLRHKHLVQLQGWCCEEDELVLVYQYMPNGSLDKILHRNNNAMSLLLTWDRRLKIVLGIASALIYLHEECERQIIHRDVKTCNIMLDDELNAKLGDFGLAEVYEHNCRTRDATIPAGTMGYLAPEYVYLGVPSVKTDVYSFGVVVLEVASGKKPVNEEGTLLADYMWELWGKGKLTEAADLKLRGKYNKLGMERMLMVGLCCVHPDYEKRPTVRDAATMIRGEAPLPVLPARKPSVSIRSAFPGGPDEFINCCGVENLDFDGTPWLTPDTHFYEFATNM